MGYISNEHTNAFCSGKTIEDTYRGKIIFTDGSYLKVDYHKEGLITCPYDAKNKVIQSTQIKRKHEVIYTESERKDRIELLFYSMNEVEGETRAVLECGDCGQLFGRRYIPYSLGHGYCVGECLCQLTARRPSKTIEERSP